MRDKVVHAMGFLSQVAEGTTHLTATEVDYWLANFSDTVFCNGQLRQVLFERITDATFKAYTKALR